MRCEIEVEGQRYSIGEVGQRHDVVRCPDGLRIGQLRGSPTLMWILEPETAGAELLRSIARAAIQEGIISDLPSD